MNTAELQRWNAGRQKLLDRLMKALKAVKDWVENEGWCPICDEHTCRAGNCILADLNFDGLDEAGEVRR